ncbi:MAG TPA: MGMT family protein [Acetobacteraceae bacterium]|nr:MGMT family protein [Acetobacteraceae bacterium]
MSGSPFFARIKGDVLRIVSAVPPGRVVTFADVGAHLDVMPRHVAYILAQLRPEEQTRTPWHRAVSADGTLATPKENAFGISQAELLREEGVTRDAAGRIARFEEVRVEVAGLPHGVPPQTRPADAPRVRRR